MLNDFIQYLIHFQIDFKRPEDIFLVVIMVLSGLLIGALIGFVFWGLYRLICIGTRISAELERSGKVIGKKFIQSSVTYTPMTVSDGKTTTTNMMPQFHSAQYLVSVEVDGYEESTIDNAELFRSVEKGDKIHVVLVETDEYRRWNSSKIINHYYQVTSVKVSDNHEIYV